MPRINCVWWNVENLFPYDSSYTSNDTSRPDSEAEYQAKLAALASVLHNLPAGEPDLLMLCEVARAGLVTDPDRNPLADLAALLGPQWTDYLPDDGDVRGITCGAIWRADRLNLIDDDIHVVTEELLQQERGRAIVELRFSEVDSGTTFTALLNHWKSRRGDSIVTKARRMAAGRELFALIQKRVCTSVADDADPDALIGLVGQSEP